MKRFLMLLIAIVSMYSCSNKKQTVATIDGADVALSDVDKVIEKQLFQFLEGVYILRKDALENLLRERVIEQEAKKKGLSTEQLLEKEIYSKLTDSLLEKKAKEINWVVADRSDPFKAYSIKTSFGRVYFKESLALLNKRKYADSLMSLHKIKILLNPPEEVRPKIDLSDINIHYEGNLTSKNTVVLIGNPDCEGCRQLKPIVDSLYKKYSASLKFGFVYFDNRVSLSSMALENSITQNKFLKMQHLLYKSHMQPDTVQLLKLAASINMDTSKLHISLKNSKYVESIEGNISKLQKKGVYTTPVLIINSKIFNAPFQYDELDNSLSKLTD